MKSVKMSLFFFKKFLRYFDREMFGRGERDGHEGKDMKCHTNKRRVERCIELKRVREGGGRGEGRGG